MCLFVSALLLIVARTTSFSEGQRKNTLNVVPKDPYVQAGTDIRITCENLCVHGEVYWTLNNELVDQRRSRAINSTHNVVSLRNITLDKATVMCRCAFTQEVLGGTILRTYSKPTKVGCIWHYSDSLPFLRLPDLFTCTWEHRHHFPGKINYTVLFTSWLDSSRSEICSSHVPTCTWKDSRLLDYLTLSGNYSVTVRAKTKHWEVDSDPFEFYPHHILQIQRPNLSVFAFSGHLLAEWTTWTASKKHDCQVKYDKEVLSKTLEAGEKGNMAIEKVESCTYYNVAVRCAWESAPWSEWSREETVLSRLNRNDVTLRLWRKVTEPGKDGVRKVYAMWMEIPSACRGTFTYFIQKAVYKGHEVQGDYGRTLCGNSTCTIRVNEEAHRVKLRVFHDEVLLAEDSVYVPAVGETSLPQVSNVRTSSTRGVISVRWAAPPQPVRGYMIDWTHDGLRYHWMESNSTSESLFGLLDQKPYDITVTPLFGDKTGLGARVLQICSTIAAAANFSGIRVEVGDKSALVSWNMEPQDICGGVILHYVVFYGTDQGPQFNVTVNGAKREVLLKDLIPYTQYSMYVKAVARTGASESNVRHFNTKRFDPDFVKKLGAVGSAVIVLLLSAGLYCAIQYKRFLEKPLPNPGLSSVALWPSGGHQKGMFPFRLFSYPSEGVCARVYTEESRLTRTDGSRPDPAVGPREEYSGPGFTGKPDARDERADDLGETFSLSSSREFSALLSEGGGQSSPYRSQGSIESPTHSTGKEFQCLLPGKHQQLAATLAMYVTVDMFEQHEGT
ncbi:interleukin-6 receptor subunit beta-like isoform X2 [Syngnathoides biaculeatus]|uniref:interleukin-6 receptor subunit beta-like isoform X2 n=1 Tax=Syngnathoides biaculeatus TaxID=300417 RepID=UPI002ADE9350|nr:interleukin-6 receptor subunit beta-like isoform X2 [Syngnathoides biaculeatus]